jgi:hypothetical protein
MADVVKNPECSPPTGDSVRDDWCRRYRHLPVKVQHAALARRLVGHFNYCRRSGSFAGSPLHLLAAEVLIEAT